MNRLRECTVVGYGPSLAAYTHHYEQIYWFGANVGSEGPDQYVYPCSGHSLPAYRSIRYCRIQLYTRKTSIRLHGFTGWPGILLFAYVPNTPFLMALFMHHSTFYIIAGPSLFLHFYCLNWEIGVGGPEWSNSSYGCVLNLKGLRKLLFIKSPTE